MKPVHGGAAGMAAAAVLTLSGCSGDVSTSTAAGDPPPVASTPASPAIPRVPESSAVAREVFTVDSLESLVAQSDVVVVGRATAVIPGRTAGDDVVAQLQFRDVTVQLEQVLHGAYAEQTLTLEELGWKDGEPVTINNSAWAVPGDRMLMGLRATGNGSTEAGPRYILTSTASRFFLDPDGDVRDNYLDRQEASPFVTETSSLDARQLVELVKAATD